MNDLDEEILVELLVVARAARTLLDVAFAGDAASEDSAATRTALRLVVAIERVDRAAVSLLRAIAESDRRSGPQLDLF